MGNAGNRNGNVNSNANGNNGTTINNVNTVLTNTKVVNNNQQRICKPNVQQRRVMGIGAGIRNVT